MTTELSKEGAGVASSQKIAIGTKGLEVGLRRFLADISPGIFLLLGIYLYERNHAEKILDLSDHDTASRLLVYFLVAIPAGFVINAAGYFLGFGQAVRWLEGWMLRSAWICGRWVTISDWNQVRIFFKLDKATAWRDLLLFRYDCESVIARFEPKWLGNFEHVGGIEILSRNIAVLVTGYLLVVWISDGFSANVAIAIGVVLLFLLLSALDSLYVGVRCIRYLFVICKYELQMKEVAPSKVLGLLRDKRLRRRTGFR